MDVFTVEDLHSGVYRGTDLSKVNEVNSTDGTECCPDTGLRLLPSFITRQRTE